MNKKEKLVKNLYEQFPYPNTLIKTKENLKKYSKWVPEIFGESNGFWKGKTVLELGCGTGDFANSIALEGAKVTAIDFSNSSIKIAKENEKKFNTKAKFIEGNILTFSSKQKFDVTIALGSLHHTINAKKGFSILSKHTKKNGLVIVGLYNKYGRFRHRIKRFFIWFFCGNNIQKRIDFGKQYFGGNKNVGWTADKYGQLHESYHSINELLNWFKEEKIKFICSKPKFKKPFFDEIKWFFSKKGAFFVMIGKKT